MISPTKFDLWWNSYPVKRVFGAIYSLGASIVILGAMFKILHLNYGGELLAIGMTTEVIVFALGVFDKPFKEFDWEKVFDFENKVDQKFQSNIIGGNGQNQVVSGSSEVVYNQPNSEAGYNQPNIDTDISKLNEDFKSISNTAQQLSNLSSVLEVTENFVKNIESATLVTQKYTTTQDALNNELEKLQTSYNGINEGMTLAEKSTSQYASKVTDMNKNLSSINLLYEIQLKNIDLQSEAINMQTESLQKVSDELNSVTSEMMKIKSATQTVVQETENFRNETTQLTRQIADLNKVYGNMLNALS
ncbi:MAG TPA: gliding motility protein GldL [Paludibacter sp.]|nr:gliding motility protein GldL [Paludibacter sp.]